MAPRGSALFAVFLLCFSIVAADHYRDLLNTTEVLVQKAKAHVDHMLNLDPLPNKDKVAVVVSNETQHLAYEIRQLETALKEKVPKDGGEADSPLSAAVTELGQIAAGLDQPGTDPKEVNSKYFAAADKVIDQLKKLRPSTGIDGVKPLINGALNGLSHDVDNYQARVHSEVGSHAGHEHAGHYLPSPNKPHQHAGGSSEESSEEHHSHPHHDHHDHH